MDAHHLIGRGTSNRMRNHAAHYDTRNGVTLCKGCHRFGIHMRTDRAWLDNYHKRMDEHLEKRGMTWEQLEVLFTTRCRLTHADLLVLYEEMRAR